MLRFTSRGRAIGTGFACLVVALALSGCVGGRCCAPCEPAPCAAPCEAPCPAPCPTVCEAPCPAPCPPCPDTKCGEVWCQYWIPPVYKTRYETVCVRPACKKSVWLPAQWGTRPKLCCCQPARLDECVTPPVWTCKQRDVLVCPPQESWKSVCCPPVGNNPCDPCVPQECWEKCCTPAVWGKEGCAVCLAPEKYGVRYRPAQYKMVEERYLVEPGRCEEVCEPPMFETRFEQVCVCPGRWEWRRNTTCETPPPPKPVDLPALQVEMRDKTESGEEEGTFRVGAVVRYDLQILGDQGNKAISGLKVVFTLPPQLEFVSGSGEEGVVITGSGQSAESSMFNLPADGSLGMEILAKVIGSPPGNFVQFTASVKAKDGTELAVETESTTLAPAAGGQ